MGVNTVLRISIVLLCAGLAGQARAEEQPPPQVVVIGTASLKAAPDQAFVTLAVESRDAKPLKAQQANAAVMDALIKKLLAAKLEKDHVRTLAYDLQEEFDYDKGRRIPRGYLARNMIEVQLDEIDRVGEIIDLAASAGANSVSSVRFDVKERAALEQEVLRRAVADAKARAQAAADGANAKLGRLLRIEQYGAGPVPPPRPMAKMAMAAEDAVATPINPGEIEINASVSLSAALE